MANNGKRNEKKKQSPPKQPHHHSGKKNIRKDKKQQHKQTFVAIKGTISASKEKSSSKSLLPLEIYNKSRHNATRTVSKQNISNPSISTLNRQRLQQPSTTMDIRNTNKIMKTKSLRIRNKSEYSAVTKNDHNERMKHLIERESARLHPKQHSLTSSSSRALVRTETRDGNGKKRKRRSNSAVDSKENSKYGDKNKSIFHFHPPTFSTIKSVEDIINDTTQTLQNFTTTSIEQEQTSNNDNSIALIQKVQSQLLSLGTTDTMSSIYIEQQLQKKGSDDDVDEVDVDDMYRRHTSRNKRQKTDKMHHLNNDNLYQCLNTFEDDYEHTATLFTFQPPKFTITSSVDQRLSQVQDNESKQQTAVMTYHDTVSVTSSSKNNDGNKNQSSFFNFSPPILQQVQMVTTKTISINNEKDTNVDTTTTNIGSLNDTEVNNNQFGDDNSIDSNDL